MRTTLEPLRWWHIPAALALDELVFGDEAWSVGMLWNELAQAGSRHYLVAVAGGAIVGYGGLAAFAGEGYIQTVGVHPQYQRRGIGTALLRALLAEAERRGVPEVYLEVRADNPVAQRLYERHGFGAVRIRPRYYQPSGTDAIEMRRRSH